jgi:hypothetical protein
MNSHLKTDRPSYDGDGLPLDLDKVGVLPSIAMNLRTASPSVEPMVSTFPYRHPLLHGSFLELCSLFHRIRSLWKRGRIREIEIGLVYQQSLSLGFLVRNERTQGRIQGIQKLLSDFPFLSGEDLHLFLLGWDAAEEWQNRMDTLESNGSTHRDPSSNPFVGCIAGKSYAAPSSSAIDQT